MLYPRCSYKYDILFEYIHISYFFMKHLFLKCLIFVLSVLGFVKHSVWPAGQ